MISAPVFFPFSNHSNEWSKLLFFFFFGHSKICGDVFKCLNGHFCIHVHGWVCKNVECFHRSSCVMMLIWLLAELWESSAVLVLLIKTWWGKQKTFRLLHLSSSLFLCLSADAFKPPQRSVEKPFRLCVSDVFKGQHGNRHKSKMYKI